MLIETYHETYAVMQHSYAGLQMDIYVCRRRSDQRLYTVIRIRNKKVTAKIIEFISVQKNSTKFSDLTDQFVFQEDLHVVFQYAEGIPLDKKLEQQCTLEERMEIGRKLLERLILLELPEYFQCQCLQPEAIIVSDSGQVGFRYTLRDAEKYKTYTKTQALACLYRILRLLFVPELQRNVLDPMADFLKQLQVQEITDAMEQYRLYCEACEEIKKIPKEELGMTKNFWYRLWNLVKSVRGRIKKAMLTLIFIGVFVYMVYSIFMAFRIKGYVRHFEYIGTMEIEEHQEELEK